MKRSAIDVLRRGIDNAVANWPLILLRIAEGIVLMAIVIGAIFAAVMPVIISAGFSNFDFGNPENASQLLASLVIEHWVLLLYLLLLALAIVTVMIAVHSFVEAGAAQVYVDAERAATLNAFTVERWWRGGTRRWWTVFWIYNLAWSVAGLIILVPLALTTAGMLMISEASGKVAMGCLGLAVTIVLFIPTALVTGMWTERAIAVCVARATAATDSLRAAWREIRLDFGRHAAVAIIIIAASFIAAAVLSGVSVPFSFGDRHSGFLPLIFAPMQIVMSLLQSIVSAAISSWFLASFVALTEER